MRTTEDDLREAALKTLACIMLYGRTESVRVVAARELMRALEPPPKANDLLGSLSEEDEQTLLEALEALAQHPKERRKS